MVEAIEKRLNMLLAGHEVKQEDYEAAIHYAARLIEIDELQEYAYQTLMIVYHKLGDYGAALKVYQNISDKLGQQLGVSPSEETQSLYQTLLAPHNIDRLKSIDKKEGHVLSTLNKRRLSTKNERLLYQVDMAIRGVVEHKIGHSFLIRGENNKTRIIIEEILH